MSNVDRFAVGVIFAWIFIAIIILTMLRRR